jgi:ABC-type amino acid transport system permease subunit
MKEILNNKNIINLLLINAYIVSIYSIHIAIFKKDSYLGYYPSYISAFQKTPFLIILVWIFLILTVLFSLSKKT